MNVTFNPDHSNDGYDEMRWHHLECVINRVESLCESKGGTGSDVKKTV